MAGKKATEAKSEAKGASPKDSEAKSTSSLEPGTAKILAAVSYLVPIIGIVLFLMLKKGENDFARFHGLQSFILGVVFFIISAILGTIIGVVSMIPFIGWVIGLLVGLLSMCIWLIFLAVAIFCLLKVMKDERYKLPYIGDLAEKNI
ncbi:Uncharacterised protein [uncultured archaeon]|nr:Uncharacterised protein [uncultured archaeon]